MKKTFLTIAAAALVMGFASCSKENEDGPIIDEGTPAYLKVSFSTPASPGTKSSTDINATDAESAFNDIDVFIFNSQGVQVKHERLAASDFEAPTPGSGSDIWVMKSSAKIATSTGPKTVIVGINLPAALSTTLNNAMEGNFTKIAQLVALADMTSTKDGFVMFSTKPEDVVLVKDPQGSENTVNVKVQRIVAKVAVQKANNVEVVGDGFMDLSKLMFTLNNTNKKTFYVQAADKKDHNWANAPAGDLADGNTDYVAVDNYGTAVLSLTPKYALENTSEKYRMGEITRVTVRGQFVPKEVLVWNSGSSSYDVVANTSSTSAQTFYLIVCENGAERSYFFDRTMALNYFASINGNGDFYEYIDGYCYWDIFLNPSGDYYFLRNEFYRCTITKIIGPGRTTPDVTDPTIPPTQATTMLVNIEMLHWNLKPQDVILEP